MYDGRAETAKPPQPGADKNEPKVTAAKGGLGSRKKSVLMKAGALKEGVTTAPVPGFAVNAEFALHDSLVSAAPRSNC